MQSSPGSTTSRAGRRPAEWITSTWASTAATNAREANLEELLRADAKYQQILSDEKAERDNRAQVDIRHDHLERMYRLITYTIRAMGND
jgi:hypothetical protein